MPLSSGTRLGAYEILELIGAGGMGEVYRARDSRLGRDVAIKVLTAVLASDAQYMARFEREAQVLASLNHSNIAAIYGIEQGALVMNWWPARRWPNESRPVRFPSKRRWQSLDRSRRDWKR